MATVTISDEHMAKVETIAASRNYSVEKWLDLHFSRFWDLTKGTAHPFHARLMQSFIMHGDLVEPPEWVKESNDAPDLGYQVLNDGRIVYGADVL